MIIYMVIRHSQILFLLIINKIGYRFFKFLRVLKFFFFKINIRKRSYKIIHTKCFFRDYIIGKRISKTRYRRGWSFGMR